MGSKYGIEKREIAPGIHSNLMAAGNRMEWSLCEMELIAMEESFFGPFNEREDTQSYRSRYRTDRYGGWLRAQAHTMLTGFIYPTAVYEYNYGNPPQRSDYAFFHTCHENDFEHFVTACFYLHPVLARKLSGIWDQEGLLGPFELRIRWRDAMFRPELVGIWRLVPKALDYADNCAIGRAGHTPWPGS